MSGKKLEIGDVFNWFTSAIQLAMKNPGVFVVMALIYAVISAIPFINIVMVVIAPALQGGFIWAAREEEAGRKADVQHLFIAFQQPGKAGPMITLCLPVVALAVVFGIVFFVAVAGVIAAAATSGNSWFGGFGLVGIALALLLAIPAALAVSFMLYFAVPRVMLDGVAPFDAMKESFALCMANLAAILVAFICIGFAFFVVAMTVGLVPFIGSMVIGMAGALLGGPSMYFAHRQMFGGSEQALDLPAPPAPPPPPVQ